MNKMKKFYFTINSLFAIVGLTLLTLGVIGFSVLSDLQTTIAEINLRIAKISETNSILSNLSERYENIKPDIEKINRAIPDKKDASPLIADISSIASQSGVKLTLVQSSTFGKKGQTVDDPSLLQTIKGKNSYELPLEIKVQGNFAGLSAFIKNLENYQRIIKISAIDVSKIANEKSPTNNVEAKIRITAYLKK
jgi:Tfp pilus assembly protein PilO